MSQTLPADGAVFAHDWLSLREPIDHAGRAHGLADIAARDLRARAVCRTPHVVDLGSGTGSNLRYLAPRLTTSATWELLDHDAGLLARIDARGNGGVDAARLTRREVDLAAPPAEWLRAADLVTGAALLDLVSAAWLDGFVAHAHTLKAHVLFALSVDGTIRFHGEPDIDDVPLLAALAQDQQRDKGLGAALGTAAPRYLINALTHCGYAVTAMPAPWHLDARHVALADALLRGWADAGVAAQPQDSERWQSWAQRRQRAVRAGRTRIEVGHIDVLGQPNQASRRRSRS